MRARYQTNPRIAIFGMALSLGLIFGAHQVNGTPAERDEAVEVEVEVDAASRTEARVTVEPAARDVTPVVDQRTC